MNCVSLEVHWDLSRRASVTAFDPSPRGLGLRSLALPRQAAERIGRLV